MAETELYTLESGVTTPHVLPDSDCNDVEGRPERIATEIFRVVVTLTLRE